MTKRSGNAVQAEAEIRRAIVAIGMALPHLGRRNSKYAVAKVALAMLLQAWPPEAMGSEELLAMLQMAQEQRNATRKRSGAIQ